MKQALKKVGIVDLLLVIAVFMIAAGLFGPIYAKSRAKVKAAPVATSTAPARPASVQTSVQTLARPAGRCYAVGPKRGSYPWPETEGCHGGRCGTSLGAWARSARGRACLRER